MVSDGRVRYCNAGHPPPSLLRADGGVESLEGSGLPLGIEEDGRHEEREVEIGLGDVLFAATDGLLETRREGAFFSDARLPGLLSEFGRTEPPQAFVERVFAAAQEWAPVLHDDVVVLALRRAPELELRDEPATGAAAQALYREYMGLVRERLGPGFVPEESIFATERVFEEERAGFVVLYARGRPVGCGGVRSLGPELAEIKRMFVTADARGRGHGRRLLAELERRAAATGATAGAAADDRGAGGGDGALRVRRVRRRRDATSARAGATSGSSGAWGARPPAGSAATTSGLMPSPVEPPGARWHIAGMNTIELRTQLLALEAERSAALAWGLADLPAYRDDLQDEIDITRAAYTTAAVTEIASLRSALSGPQVG